MAYIEYCLRLRSRKSVNSLCANKNYLCSSWYNCIFYARDEFIYLYLYACYEDRIAMPSLVVIVADLYGCVMCLVHIWAVAATVAAATAPLFALFCITASFNPCLLMSTREIFLYQRLDIWYVYDYFIFQFVDSISNETCFQLSMFILVVLWCIYRVKLAQFIFSLSLFLETFSLFITLNMRTINFFDYVSSWWNHTHVMKRT